MIVLSRATVRVDYKNRVTITHGSVNISEEVIPRIEYCRSSHVSMVQGDKKTYFWLPDVACLIICEHDMKLMTRDSSTC